MPSGCYVYAIVRRDAVLPWSGLPGSTAALTLVPWRDLAAVIAPIDDGVASLTAEAVLHHEAVVEAVRQHGPALPVRFGTVFRDVNSVVSALAKRYEALTEDLERLGDKLEMSLTALWSAPPSIDAASHTPGDAVAQSEGARYLHARAAELRRDEALKDMARAVAEDVDRVLGGFAIERRVSLLPTPRIAVRIVYLLAPAESSAFRAAFEAMRGTRAGLRVLLTGPWPPYSFVRRTEGERGAVPDDRLAALAQLLADTMPTRAG